MATEHELSARWQDDLLPHVVDRLARERPDAKYGEWVGESSVVAITYAQLANVINGLAGWLVKQLGPGRYEPQTDVLAYIGPNDVRYSALVLAAIKAGYVLFVASPRNSPAAHRALFEQLKCRTLITSDPTPPPARIVLDAVQPLVHLSVPSIEDLLSTRYPQFALAKTYKDLRQCPFVVMHTSGTTGLPKPIIWTNETCVQVLESKTHEAPGGIPSVEGTLLKGKRIIVTLPPFHGALLAQFMVGAIPYGNVVITPVTSAIPTAQGVVNALKQSPADTGLFVPSVVAELGQNSELLDYCASHLESLLYIGGDLPDDIGNRVAAKIYLRCQWGATETGIVPQLLPQPLLASEPSSRTLWRYLQFGPSVGAVFDETTDGLHELVVHRNAAPEDIQPCFTVPGLNQQEYRTKDLFERHPTIPDIWRWRARSDDIIVFLNGEKTNPTSMEQYIQTNCPELRGALVVGAQRFQAALLIEPVSESLLSTVEQAALIERVWPHVEEANRSAPAHARVEKSFIMVVPSDRRLIYAGKGTLLRGPNISQYAKEIEKLYSDTDPSPDDSNKKADKALLYAMGFDGISRQIRQQVNTVTGWTSLEKEENFFDRGMDSLQGLQVVRALRRSFHRHNLALSTIYQNPTILQLTEAILEQRGDGQDGTQVMKTLFATYRGLIKEIPITQKSDGSSDKSAAPLNILLTGSTGAIGTQLLRALLSYDGIGHVFCLNRGVDGGKAVQYKRFTATNLSTTGLDDRVTFVRADLQQPNLGLNGPTYKLLCTQVGVIIHAAWPVNFNLPLTAFRPQLAGLVNLLALAAATVISPVKFVFISSVAAVEGIKTEPAAEKVFDILNTPAPFGYGCAKFIAEMLVDAGAQHLGNFVSAVVVRIGQVAGPVRQPGLWNPKEWFPSIVLSSLYLGQVPDSLGPSFDNVDFVPVDVLADVLVELSMATATANQASGTTTVFNVRNPHSTPWSELIPAVNDAARERLTAPGNVPLKVVPPATWLASLRVSSDGDDSDIAVKNPAVKLIDFFAALWIPSTETNNSNTPAIAPPMAIERALASSTALRELGPVRSEWMRKWVEEWISTLEK